MTIKRTTGTPDSASAGRHLTKFSSKIIKLKALVGDLNGFFGRVMLNLVGQYRYSQPAFEFNWILSQKLKLLLVDVMHSDKFYSWRPNWYRFCRRRKTATANEKMSEIDLLMKNARLRDEIEPFLDESLYVVDLDRMSTDNENEYLTSMLDWERAPVLPICNWFEPPLVMPSHDTLSDNELKQQLYQVIGRLYEKNITLHMTEHLSDRQLYCLIVRDILPAQEKRVCNDLSNLRWQCIDPAIQEETWLRFYATVLDRQAWQEETQQKLPPRERIPFPRKLPQDI